MGSVTKDSKGDEFTVLVTGFGPFRQEYPQNPSWEIASRLPSYLPRKGGAKQAGDDDEPPVRIVVYPAPIRVSYEVVRKLVPTLWDGVPTGTPEASASTSATGTPETASPPPFTPPAHIDLVLHIGMAGPRQHYALERFGRRDGYDMPDVDHRRLGDTPADHADPAWPWFGVPPLLETHVALDDVLAAWKQAAGPAHDLRISTDAGRYLCDFIYFSSLAHLFRRSQETGAAAPDSDPYRRRVVFLHVPASAAPERIAVGRELVLHLLRALVATERAGRGQDGKPKTGAETTTETEPKMGAETTTETEPKTDEPKQLDPKRVLSTSTPPRLPEPTLPRKWYSEEAKDGAAAGGAA